MLTVLGRMTQSSEENENIESQEVTCLAIKLKTSGMPHGFPAFEVTMVRADY